MDSLTHTSIGDVVYGSLAPSWEHAGLQTLKFGNMWHAALRLSRWYSLLLKIHLFSCSTWSFSSVGIIIPGLKVCCINAHRPQVSQSLLIQERYTFLSGHSLSQCCPLQRQHGWRRRRLVSCCVKAAFLKANRVVYASWCLCQSFGVVTARESMVVISEIIYLNSWRQVDRTDRSVSWCPIWHQLSSLQG